MIVAAAAHFAGMCRGCLVEDDPCTRDASARRGEGKVLT
jgi:hypothetical protein